MKSNNNDNNTNDLINYYNFNEDGSCISIGTKIGFKIVTCDPFTNYQYRKFGRGIEIVEMYQSSNIIAFVRSESNSKIPLTKLIIWDDNKEDIIREIRVSSKIRIIKIIKNILFIVNDIKIYIFNFEDLSLISSYEIFLYEKELISFSVNKNIKIAYVCKNKKQIFIENIDTKKQIKIKNIDDDELKYSYIQFNQKGDIIAGAMKGKIHLYKTSNGEFIREIDNDNLNIGNINCISFSEKDKFLAVSTIEDNSGRINIFDIGTKKETSFFDLFMSNKDTCFAYYKMNTKGFIFRFNKEDSILIITQKGNFIKINIDKENGGYCKKVIFKNVFE
jgi:WD40 repeat protein